MQRMTALIGTASASTAHNRELAMPDRS